MKVKIFDIWENNTESENMINEWLSQHKNKITVSKILQSADGTGVTNGNSAIITIWYWEDKSNE